MYGADFWDRATFQQLCEFMRTGAERFTHEEGTAEERHKRYSKAYSAGMRSFREKVLAYDWDSCRNSHDKDMATDDLWIDALSASGDLNELAFEVGFRAGLLVGRELYSG